MFMIDEPEDEANDIAVLVPNHLTGPATLVRVKFKDEADVQVPVDETTAMQLVTEWREHVKDRTDPRQATKDSLISYFMRKKHMEQDGMSSIVAAVLSYTMTSGHEQAFKDVLKAGGHCLFARITDEDGVHYRFRAELIPVT